MRPRPRDEEPFQSIFLGVGLVLYVGLEGLTLLTNQVARHLPSRDLSTSIDDALPVLPGFVWPYMLFWVFPFVVFFVVRDWHRYNRMLLAACLSTVAACVVFLLVPVIVPRPVLGESASERTLAWVYTLDENARTTNFPSLHTALAWLVVAACRRQGLSRAWWGVLVAAAVLISLSTFLTKMHFLVDTIVGVLWAAGAWWLSGRIYRLVPHEREEAGQTLRRLLRRLLPLGRRPPATKVVSDLEIPARGAVPGDVSIRPAELPREAKRLVRAWIRLHRNVEHWVPPLISERLRFLDPVKNPYFDAADVRMFVAERAGEVVGTIAATVDHQYQEKAPGVGFFGFFEFGRDAEVAGRLLDAGCAWLRRKGMQQAHGPFSFTSNHEFGLLVDGFDRPAMVGGSYNEPHVVTIYDKLGLQPVREYSTYWVEVRGDPPPVLARLEERLQRHHAGILFRTMDLARWDREVRILLAIYNDAWAPLWGSVAMTEAEFTWTAKNLKALLDPSTSFVAEIDGEAVGAAVALPDFNPVLKRMKGRLFPFGWIHALRARALAESYCVLLIGVRRSYQHLPVGGPFYLRMWSRLLELGVPGIETTPVLDTNHRMRSAAERMGGRVIKTFRLYERNLTD